MSDRSILHVDMDAFYASVEILENPELAGKPVIVGGPPESRGVVAAASYEVRKFGVHSAMSSYRALKLCPNAIIIPPRMSHYAMFSKKIFAILKSYTPVVEPISIDEAFLDVTGSRRLFGTAVQIGRDIKKRVRNETGLTASVGVAPNKFLAKLASDLEKPDGFVVIEQENAAAVLANLPVSKLWGIGRVTQKTLAGEGITTVRELLALTPKKLEALVGSYGPRLCELARGVDERHVIVGEPSKSIGAETTFAKDIESEEELQKRLRMLTERVAKRLRKEGYRAHTIQIKARYPDFKTVTRAATLPGATASSQSLHNVTWELFADRLGRKGRPLRLLGVSASNLVRPNELEPELFPDGREKKREKVDRVLDSLQNKFGAKTIWRGEKSDSYGED